MSVLKVAAQLERAAAMAAPTAAKRGMLAVIEQRRSYTMMHGPTVREFAYVPGKVASVDRGGLAKAVLLVDGRRIEARDWTRVMVDTGRMVADVDAVLAQLVDNGWPREFTSMDDAVSAIKAAAGVAETASETVPKMTQKRDSQAWQAEAQRGHLRVVETAPIRDNETVRTAPPRRRRNADVREREYLTEKEVELLYQAAKAHGRHGARDALMIWMAYRHGFRVGELCGLRWGAHIDFAEGTVRCERLKRGVDSTHPLSERELRGLRRLQKLPNAGRYVFVNERGAPISEPGFRKTLARIAATVPALADLMVHPHMLRHAAGFSLANKGTDTRSLQHYLGHRRIEHTERYTALSSTRFDRIWD